MANRNPDIWMTPPQVAAYFDVQLRTLRNWIRRRRVTTRPDGQVDVASVYDYLDRRGSTGQHHGAQQVGEAGQHRPDHATPS